MRPLLKALWQYRDSWITGAILGLILTIGPGAISPLYVVTLPQRGTYTGGGGAGPNNITVISTTGNNMNNTGASCDIAGLSSVSAGNSVLIAAIGVNTTGALSFSAAGVTQIAGTATIGTPVMVRHTDGTTALDMTSAHFIVPITGSGSIGLRVAASATCYMIVGALEAHNLNASPLDGNNIATGTGTTHSTGAITTTNWGLIMYGSQEQVGADFTRTYSDTLIFKVDTASTDFTGCIQYKLTSSNSNTLTDTTGAQSGPWQATWAAYKTN